MIKIVTGGKGFPAILTENDFSQLMRTSEFPQALEIMENH